MQDYKSLYEAVITNIQTDRQLFDQLTWVAQTAGLTMHHTVDSVLRMTAGLVCNSWLMFPLLLVQYSTLRWYRMHLTNRLHGLPAASDFHMLKGFHFSFSFHLLLVYDVVQYSQWEKHTENTIHFSIVSVCLLAAPIQQHCGSTVNQAIIVLCDGFKPVLESSHLT